MQTFKPAWWCPGAHAQTIAGGLLSPRTRVPLRRKRLELPDGDFLDVDFLDSPSSSNGQAKAPLVVIFHGLEGSSLSPYVQNLLAEIQKAGWGAAAVNMRMCSGETNRLQQTYHSGKTEDLDAVVDHLSETQQGVKLYLAGFSIGGNMVLKWLGEQGSKAKQKICKAAAVSVPYDLARSVALMDQGFNREVYTRALLTRLKEKVASKQKIFPDAIGYDRVKECVTFSEFDREVTAPLNGFKDEADYWSQASCKNFLGSIHIQTLLIHAEDDPFFPGTLLPYDQIGRSEFLETLIVPHGGHLGFMAGWSPWTRDFWLENQILDFFYKA